MGIHESSVCLIFFVPMGLPWRRRDRATFNLLGRFAHVALRAKSRGAPASIRSVTREHNDSGH
eukprot:3817382-Pyramimonas_sp.AAC.2